MKLIDKDALVAELKKRIRDYWSDSENTMGIYPYALEEVIKYIETLEVKENDLLTEEETEKELAESYINIFDKKFGDKLPNLKGKQLAEFKNLINTCEQTFYMKYFDYHATQGKLFEKLALLWAVWGKEHLSLEVKEVDLEKELSILDRTLFDLDGVAVKGATHYLTVEDVKDLAKHFFELGINTQKKDKDESIQRF